MKIVEGIVRIVLWVLGAIALVFLGWLLRGLKEREDTND